MEKRLYRSRTDRMLWGVYGGLAKYFDIDPTLVRVIAIVLLIATNIMAVVAYIVLAIVVPLEGTRTSAPRETIKENVAEIKETATQLGEELRSTWGEKRETTPEESTTKTRQRRLNALGIVLIVLGILFLVAFFNPFPWLSWRYLWPLVLVAIGVLVIWNARRK